MLRSARFTSWRCLSSPGRVQLLPPLKTAEMKIVREEASACVECSQSKLRRCSRLRLSASRDRRAGRAASKDRRASPDVSKVSNEWRSGWLLALYTLVRAEDVRRVVGESALTCCARMAFASHQISTTPKLWRQLTHTVL